MFAASDPRQPDGRYPRVRGSVWIIAVLLSCSTARTTEAPRKGARELKFDIDRDVSFEMQGMQLELRNPRLSGPCSPDITEGIGLAINAPREVQFSNGPHLDPDDARFIVCAASNFVYNTLGFGSAFIDKVTFVIVDARTHQSRSRGTRAGRPLSPAYTLAGPRVVLLRPRR